jgi:hypothetical protein
MLTIPLMVTYLCFVTAFQLLALSGRISAKQYAGWMALWNTGAGVMSALNGWTATLYLNAGFAAWHAWVWWQSGGGDGTRRRLKSWARQFQGVRRTAPEAA